MLPDGQKPVLRLKFISNGWLAATFGRGETVQAWDIRAGDPAAHSLVLRDGQRQDALLGFSPDGRMVTSRDDGTVQLTDFTTPSPSETALVLRGHQGRVRAMTFSPDGRLVTSNGTSRLWDLALPDPSKGALVLQGGEDALPDQLMFVGDRQLAVVNGSGVRVWNIKGATSAPTTRMLRSFDGAAEALAFSSNGQLVIGGTDGDLHEWNLDAPEAIRPFRTIPLGKTKVEALAFGLNDKLVAGDNQGHLRLVVDISDADPSTRTQELPGQATAITALDISPDGRLVIADQKGTVRAWNLAADDPAATLQVLGAGAKTVKGHQLLRWRSGAMASLSSSAQGLSRSYGI